MIRNILIVFLVVWLVVAPGCCTLAQGGLFKEPPVPYGGTLTCTLLIGLAVTSEGYTPSGLLFFPFLVADWFLSFALDTVILPVSLLNSIGKRNVYQETTW